MKLSQYLADTHTHTHTRTHTHRCLLYGCSSLPVTPKIDHLTCSNINLIVQVMTLKYLHINRNRNLCEPQGINELCSNGLYKINNFCLQHKQLIHLNSTKNKYIFNEILTLSTKINCRESIVT